MRRVRSTFAGALLVVCAALLAFSCSSTTKPAGGLELVISTDMPTPGEFDALRLEISQQTSTGGLTTLIQNDFQIPSEAVLPTTFAIAAGSSPDQEAIIRLTALLDGNPVVLREVQIQVPKDHVAELKLVLSSRCAGAANVVVDGNGNAESTCASASDSCQPDTGTCGATAIDSSTLPTYAPSDLDDAGVPTTVGDAAAADASLGPVVDGALAAADGQAGDSTVDNEPDSAVLPDTGVVSSNDSGPGASDASGADAGEIDPTQTKTLTMDSVSIPSSSEVYYCQNFANPWAAQVDIKTYSLTMGPGASEFYALYDSNATNAAAAMCPSVATSFGPFSFGTSDRGMTLAYPDTVGATLPATTGLTLFVHYINSGAQPITLQVSLAMSIARPGVVSQHAGVIFLNNTTMTVPPTDQPVTSPDTYAITQSANVFASTSEMSQYATNFTATAGSQTLSTTTEWNQPPLTTYAQPLQIASGTTLSWSCTNRNPTGSTLTFGDSINSVKCVSLSFFYPVSDVNNPVIGNSSF